MKKTSTNYNEQYNTYLNKLALAKKEYEDRIIQGGLSKETNKKYKDKFKVLEEKVIYIYKRIENKRNKYIIYNYSIFLLIRKLKIHYHVKI